MIEADGKGLSEKGRRALEIMAERRAKEVALGDKYLGVIKARTPVGKSTWGERVVETGDTRKSWTLHILQNDLKGVRWVISPDGREDIMTFLEFGTKAHIIVPKKPGGVLVFEVDGETVFTKIVHHPRTKPLGIVRLTRQELKQESESLNAQMHAANRLLNHH